MNSQTFKAFCFVPIILLVIAPILPLPYSFYIFLRYLVTIYSLIVLYHLYLKTFLIVDLEITLAMLVMAVLYNPVYQINLNRELWFPINWLSAGMFFWYYRSLKEIDD